LLFRGEYATGLSFYKCFKEKGYNDVNVFYFPGPDSPTTAHIISAKNAGLNVHATYYSFQKDNP